MDAGVQVQLLVEILNHYVLFYEVMLVFLTHSRWDWSFIGWEHKYNSWNGGGGGWTGGGWNGKPWGLIVKKMFFLLFDTIFSGGWWKAADRTALHQQFATHASKEGCWRLEPLPGAQVVACFLFRFRWQTINSGTPWRVLSALLDCTPLLWASIWGSNNGQCSLLCDDCLYDVIFRKCRNIYLFLSNTDTELCAFELAWNIPVAF